MKRTSAAIILFLIIFLAPFYNFDRADAAVAQWRICPPNTTLTTNTPYKVANGQSIGGFVRQYNAADIFAGGLNKIDLGGFSNYGMAGGFVPQLLHYSTEYSGGSRAGTNSAGETAFRNTGVEPGQWVNSAVNTSTAEYPGVSKGPTDYWDPYNRWRFEQSCNATTGSIRVGRSTNDTSRISNGVGRYWSLRAPNGDMTIGNPNSPTTGMSYVHGLFSANAAAGGGADDVGISASASVYNMGPGTSYSDPEIGNFQRAKTRCFFAVQNLNHPSTDNVAQWVQGWTGTNNTFTLNSSNGGLCGNPTLVNSYGGTFLTPTFYAFPNNGAPSSNTTSINQVGPNANWNGSSTELRSTMALEIRCMRGTNLSCHNNTSHYISGRDITVNVTDNTSQYLFTDRQNYYGGGNESYGYDAGSGENYNNAQNIIGTILNTGEKASTNIGAQRWVRSLVYSNWSAGDPGLGFGAAAQVFANTSNSWVEPPKWVMPNTNAIGYGWNNNTGCAVWDSTPSGTAIGWNQGSVYRVFPPNSGTYQNPSGSSTAVAGARNIGFCNNWFNIHQNVQTNSWFPDGINYIYYCGKKHTLDTNVATASAPTLGNLSAPGLLGNGFPSMCHRRNFIVDNTLPAASGNLITAGTVSHYGNIQGWIRGNAQYNISGGETPSMVASGSRAIYGEAQNIGNANQNPIPSLANKSLYDKNNSNSWDGSNDNEGLYDNLGIIGAYGTYTRQSPIPGCGQLGAGMYSINCWVNTENGQYGEGDLIALRARASDLAGNAQTSPVGYRRVDNSPPAILYAVTGQGLPAPDINSGHYTGMDYSPSFWYTSPVDLHAVTGGLNPYGSGARAVRVCTNSTLQANCTVPTGYTGNDISAANRLTGDLTSAPMGNGFINAPAYTISSPTRVAIRGEDIAGNLSSEISFTAKVDLNNPSVSVSGVPAGWTNAASVPVTATATDSAASINSGINEIHFVGSGTVAGSGTPNIAPGNYVSQYYTPPANGVASSTQNRSFTFTNEGAHRYYVSTYDAASRAEGTGDFWIRIDRSLPTSTITMPVGAVGTIINGSSPVTVAASDQALLAGVNQLRYSVLPGASQNCGSVNWATASNVPVGAPATNVSGSVNPPAGTTSTICVRSTDAAGNVSAVASSNVTVDNSLPTLTVTGDNPGSWSNVDLSVTANANDTITGIASLARNNVSGSGTSQNTGTSNWATSPNTLRTWNGTYSNEQSRIYNFIATDGGGNTASDQVEINIDKTAPTVTAPAQANVLEGVQLTATASDQATLSGAANGRFEFCTLSSKANCDAAPIGSWDTANAWASGPNACTGGNLGTGGGLSGTGAHPNKTYTCTIDSTTPKNASGNVYVRLRARDNAGNEAISTGGSVEVAVPTTVCKLIYYKD